MLIFRPNSKTLKVLFVRTEDAGVFECQVSTSPKLSLIFRLSVLGKWQQAFSVLGIIQSDSKDGAEISWQSVTSSFVSSFLRYDAP